jgi:hypothetical protein
LRFFIHVQASVTLFILPLSDTSIFFVTLFFNYFIQISAVN